MAETSSFPLCSKINYPSKRQFSQDILPIVVEKTKQLYVLALAKCYSVTVSFNLWMSKGAYDVFALLLIFWEVIGSLNMLPLAYLK